MNPVSVHCPAHITLLFSIHDADSRPSHQGSRGAGFCVESGVRVEARISERSFIDDHRGEVAGRVRIWDSDGALLHIEEELASYRMYSDIASLFRQSVSIDESESVDLDIWLELPRSQGFGMSAAGLIAAIDAHAEIMKTDEVDIAWRLSHDYERAKSTGLGDVLALSAGGVELRLEPGAPPSPGSVVAFAAEAPVLLVWSPDEGRHTSGYIDSPDWRDRISGAGEAAVARLREGEWNTARWSELLVESRRFAEASGLLAEPERKALLQEVDSVIGASDDSDSLCACLCMLGVSAAVLPRSLERPVDEAVLDEVGESLRSLGMCAKVTRIAALQS